MSNLGVSGVPPGTLSSSLPPGFARFRDRGDGSSRFPPRFELAGDIFVEAALATLPPRAFAFPPREDGGGGKPAGGEPCPPCCCCSCTGAL